MTHLTVSDQVERKKEHDMPALKRQDTLTLRQGAAKGSKVLYVWDRAGIDFPQWFKWKESGIYFLSREKENMKLERPRKFFSVKVADDFFLKVFGFVFRFVFC
jgi:hypothetical protein